MNQHTREERPRGVASAECRDTRKAMRDQLTPVQFEYRRRRYRVARVVILSVLVPFGLEALFISASAPPLLLSIGMAATMLGILIAVVFVFRVWECPACGIKLWSAGVGTRRGKCLGCHVQLYVPRGSMKGTGG